MYYSTIDFSTVPVLTGTPPPPIVFFSLHNLPTTNMGIMFGGTVIDRTRVYCTNDTYLLSVSKSQVVSY